MLLRCVDGGPVSAGTPPCLQGVLDRLAAAGQAALRLGWATASWHVSQAVRAWLMAHKRRGKREGGCRVGGCPWPIKSPWLNRMEPTWGPGTRAMAEPERKWYGDALQHRSCAYDDCERLDPMTP